MLSAPVLTSLFIAPVLLTPAPADTETTDVSISIVPTLAIATYVNNVPASSVSVNITPSDSGTLANAQYPVRVEVSTNNPSGYSQYRGGLNH